MKISSDNEQIFGNVLLLLTSFVRVPAHEFFKLLRVLVHDPPRLTLFTLNPIVDDILLILVHQFLHLLFRLLYLLVHVLHSLLCWLVVRFLGIHWNWLHHMTLKAQKLLCFTVGSFQQVFIYLQNWGFHTASQAGAGLRTNYLSEPVNSGKIDSFCQVKAEVEPSMVCSSKSYNKLILALLGLVNN